MNDIISERLMSYSDSGSMRRSLSILILVIGLVSVKFESGTLESVHLCADKSVNL